VVVIIGAVILVGAIAYVMTQRNRTTM